jgi:threonine dehydratase
MTLPEKKILSDARERIAPYIHHTPVLTSSTLNELTGAEIFFKCENFQRMGAFKMRGAAYALSSLQEAQLAKGVVTHSSGNFAQAVALAAKLFGVKARIVMPENAPKVKVEAVRGYGAEIIFCGSLPSDREAEVEKMILQEGLTFIHPSNDLNVIIGNSTAAQELIEEINSLDVIMSPIGGGGILAGTALAAHHFSPDTTVLGAEPKNMDDAYRSLLSGTIEFNSPEAYTIADGLRTNLGSINFPILQALTGEVLCVSEDEIRHAMWWVWERMKIIIEPSSAVVVAAVLRYRDQFNGKRVGLIITGGNADIFFAEK